MQGMLDSIEWYCRSASVRTIEYKEKIIMNATVHAGREIITEGKAHGLPFAYP
jgi:hypothetical protein